LRVETLAVHLAMVAFRPALAALALVEEGVVTVALARATHQAKGKHGERLASSDSRDAESSHQGVGRTPLTLAAS
jgi:hypothetical protein